MTIEKKAVRAGKFVDTNHVDTLRKNYKEKRWQQNSERIGKVDSLSVWFSLEDMEIFLEKLKQHGGDGVRFYFGAYDENYTAKPLYAGRQTVVMVATKEKQTLAGELNKDIYITTDKGNSILAFNIGRPCPPLCQNSEEEGLPGTFIDKAGKE